MYAHTKREQDALETPSREKHILAAPYKNVYICIMKTVKKHSKKSKTRRIRGGNPTCKYNKNVQTYNISISETDLMSKNLTKSLRSLCKSRKRLSDLLSQFPNSEDVYSTKGVYDGRRDLPIPSSKSKSK
jgi:hypothetical protein